jgi:hypothetical protein
MKKILLSICFGLTAFTSVNAQQKQPVMSAPMRMDNAVVDGPLNKDKFKTAGKKTRGGSTFMRYVDYVALQEGISPTTLDGTGFLNYMFPDSAVRYGAPSSAFGIQWKSIGQVLEPWADVIRDNTAPDEIFIGKTNAYTVDSIFIRTAYIKKTAAVDTVIVSVVHSGGANLPEYYFTGMSGSFFVDTTRFLLQSYNATNFNSGAYQTNASGAPAAITIKYPLTNADSSTFTAPNSYGSKYLGFAINMAVPAGERVSVSYTFKPGYTYAAGDTVGKNNHMLFLSYEPNGDATFMPFYPADRNMSSVISKDSSGWVADYIPTLAWTVGYSTEMHDMFWKLTCPTCSAIGVNDVNDNGMSVNVTPNPATENAKLTISLTEAAKNVSVTFTNAVGQQVKTMNLGSVNANDAQKFNVKISDLTKGLYIYTVNADGKKYSNKLMVN